MMPLHVLADMLFYPKMWALAGCSFALSSFCSRQTAGAWFELSVVVDVWLFFGVFLVRKTWWLGQNIWEKDEIVNYFRGTCWTRIERAPVTEFVYCATSGQINVLGLQLGKFIILWIAGNFELTPQLEAFYILGTVLQIVAITCFPAKYIEINNEVFRWHHAWHHIDPSEYMTKHFEHHDVVPVASIGSASVGFQEGVHRSVCLPYINSIFFGYNVFQYHFTAYDEWAHNFCPTARHSEILELKPIHLEHHMNHTKPLGLELEAEEINMGFKYDKSLWERIQSFMPEKRIPERGPNSFIIYEHYLKTSGTQKGNQVLE